MFGVVFYTVAGRYENGVYKKISLRNIVVKFATLSQYAYCDFTMNIELKPLINELINSKGFTFDDEKQIDKTITVKWEVDDVIARRSFFVWKKEDDNLQHIDVTNLLFPKPPAFWIVKDYMYSSFMKTLFEERSIKKRKTSSIVE